MATTKIGIIIGSLRKESFCRKLAKTLISLTPANFEMKEIPINELAMFNQDFEDEGQTPAAWTTFRTSLKQLDAVLFITPEYNRSVPAVIKNAIDIGSRPYGKNIWDGKPGAVISISPGGLSAFGANHHLRQSLVFLNIPTMSQPEAYIGNAATLFDNNGTLINETTRQFLLQFMTSFATWIKTNAPPK